MFVPNKAVLPRSAYKLVLQFLNYAAVNQAEETYGRLPIHESARKTVFH